MTGWMYRARHVLLDAEYEGPRCRLLLPDLQGRQLPPPRPRLLRQQPWRGEAGEGACVRGGGAAG